MNWQKKIPKILTVIIFAGLLIGTALSSRRGFLRADEANKRNVALKEYGFFLEPINNTAGINFRHLCPQIDPKVKNIKITIYRLAQISHVASSLINAAKNGKKVTVAIEIQARFDEQANIDYAEQMQTDGVNLLFGVKGLKVHSKMCVIEREENNKIKRYGFLSTGN